MTNEEWELSQNAAEMLLALKSQQSQFFKNQAISLHYYFLECSNKIAYLTPQKDLRNAIQAGYDWLNGIITDGELKRYEWYAEAEVFMIEFDDDPENKADVEKLIKSIAELQELNYAQAKNILHRAAYFIDAAMGYAFFWKGRLPKLLINRPEFLDADLLRKHIKPSF
ncbi:hypothetical protein [Kordiimonas sp. SCSIO 12610]|uniref:hypothetical protein n=1 Tax=Kordiimonas sp. SCSIO 12610 TaxID=2829597 RepID=UPI00210B1EF1|nr:hypothetical protein [Kordiimonas sp. SCSIO 12610]UTW56052.1 hypothetical protein KFF44_03930 [Kordiimonas sp. SCSIO 12610]